MTNVPTYIVQTNVDPGDTINLPFEVADQDEIVVTADGVTIASALYTWTGAQQITTNFSTSAVVRVERVTPVNDADLEGTQSLDGFYDADLANKLTARTFRSLQEHRDLLSGIAAIGSLEEMQDLTSRAEAAAASTDLDGAPVASSKPAYYVGKDGSGGLVLAFGFGVNALDYGVREANTGAQNALALANAITAVLARPKGGKIILPNGDYTFDPANPVSFPKTSGKVLEFEGEGWGTRINVGNGDADDEYAFYVGSASTPGGGTGFRCKNMRFVGASATTGIAFNLNNANGACFDRVCFETMRNAALMNASYSVKFLYCQFENVGGANIYSSTHCHHLLVVGCDVFNAGVAGSAQFLHIDAGHTDNLVIRDSDFEYCRQIIRADDGLSHPTYEGNYTEYCVVDPFNFGTGCRGMSFRGGWLALGLAFTFHNWTGGCFEFVRLWDQAVSFGSDCTNVHVVDIELGGTSTLSTSNLMHTIASFLNSASANGTYPPKYSKSDGVVQLHGQVDNCPGGGSPVFALPAGYRPLQTGCWAAVAGDNTTFRAIIVDAANGNVVPSAPSSGTVRLDGVMFRTAT